ncbi:hypothetical protein DNTS_014998 [Danionella cerebrum]|uniref:C2 domain-containing protein n=1 Tax=Danionella cerebrum TaxID=2873325 RepID=A0A553QFR8_9TELE|nr:hypothetical protein DNTS_014998 [Danionella translucida]TRY88778.1 hypothetical protein DNTS_014998 [Danionella translucida]
MVQNMEINVSFLTDSEQEFILEVLRRDEEVRRLEDLRVRKLKAELMEIKRKGAKRGSGNYSERSCARCQEPLGILTSSGDQCRVCKHQVCKKCQSIRDNGSWLCTVCAKEIDVKMSTGDWFYDERVNRFFSAPGHDLVRVSLRKRPMTKKHETAGETLLNKVESISSQSIPVAKPRQKDIGLTKRAYQLRDVWHKLFESCFRDLDAQEEQHRATESIGNASVCSLHTDTISAHSTPKIERKEVATSTAILAGSAVSILMDPAIKDSPATIETASLIHQMNACSDSLRDADGLFKKSVRKVHKISDMKPVSTLDLRDDAPVSMGDRSKSVPHLNADDEEEEEDIDNLVNIHRQKFGDSMGSLGGSRNTLNGSMMSVYSEAGDYEHVEVSGEIIFSLSYDEPNQSLFITVHECRGLAYADPTKKKCNPNDLNKLLKALTWNVLIVKTFTHELFCACLYKYSIGRTQLMTRTLQLSVWHYDRFGHNAFLGEVEIPVGSHDIYSGLEECMALRAKAAFHSPSTPFDQYRGELVISLKYVTNDNPYTEGSNGKGKKSKPGEGSELHILIKEARNLTPCKAGGTCDSFVKGYLLSSQNKASSKKKTAVVKRTLNPNYNHTFVYNNLSLEQLRDMSLELSIWDRETRSSNDFLGGVRLSLGAGTVQETKEERLFDSTAEEISLWKKMMQYPGSWAEGALPLRSSMGKAK